MKIQMKFQKILTIISLIIAALTFVFALSFLSGSGSNIQSYKTGMNGYYEGTTTFRTFAGVDDFFSASQAFVGALVVLSVIYICSVLLLMITSSNTRRKYYITNYIAVGLHVVLGLVLVFYILIEMIVLLGLFNSIDWTAVFDFYNANSSKLTIAPTQDTYMYPIGIVLSLIVLLNVAAWALNFIWKLKLMKGEKTLLEQGLVQEVA